MAVSLDWQMFRKLLTVFAEYDNLNKIKRQKFNRHANTKQSDANSVKVCELVKEEMAKIEMQYASSELKSRSLRIIPFLHWHPQMR